MSGQVVALALAASIYPPALAVVITLGRGPRLRSRVVLFVLGALLITYAGGTVMLLVLVELGAVGAHHRTTDAALDLILGVGLFALALHLRNMPSGAGAPAVSSRWRRYLQSRRLAFALGVILYLLPSPIYIGAVKEIADARLSTHGELLALAATVVLMLWLIELPMVMLLAVPDRASVILEGINSWFGKHGRPAAVAVLAGVGAYLIGKGGYYLSR
jgi:hypothetical protein